MSMRRYLPSLLLLGLLAGGCIPDVVPDEASLPNCYGVAPTCGVDHDVSCCNAKPVPQGDFMLTDDQMSGTAMATVSSFILDGFEVTVGRFRQFVADYPHSAPAPGDGAYARIPDSGWNPAWDFGQLPTSAEQLLASIKCDPDFQTWTDSPGPNEDLPINCLNWQVAFAFCAWDGGRLPTDAEWSYAASGGGAQRSYPWGNAAPDASHAVYCADYATTGCVDPVFGDILPVGSKLPGDGLYGQADLAGSMGEWTLDWFNAFPTTCADCANLDDPEQRNLRSTWGGDWAHDATGLHAFSRIGRPADTSGQPLNFVGVRCARDVPPPARSPAP
jgi:formylglycine-generating enzyme